MRNASEQDLGDGNWNVYAMYQVEHPWHGILLAHIKEQVQFNYKNMLAMETADGCPIIAEYPWLRPIHRKQGTPAKTKKAHQRGTKHWLSKFEYVDYDPKLITPGVRVKCRDKKTRTVEDIERFPDGFHVISFTDECTAFLPTGKANYGENPWHSDIMKILVEKSVEPLPVISDCRQWFREVQDEMVLNAVLKTFQNSCHDPYNGYAKNVWHFWQGLSDKPPVDGDVVVNVWCRSCMVTDDSVLQASRWCWKWGNRGSDVIAFKIVSD